MPGELLLVDDDPLIRTVLADDLADSGFDVHVAADAAQAFATLKAHPTIGVALVDYCLPKPVGIELCRDIADDHPNLAVALYTGHPELADIRRGEDDLVILSKSLRQEQLASAITALFEGRRPVLGDQDMASRVEVIWRQELKRETVQSVGRAMHNQFDRTLREPLPQPLSDTVMRMFRARI